jgi:hypothetical protein
VSDRAILLLQELNKLDYVYEQSDAEEEEEEDDDDDDCEGNSSTCVFCIRDHTIKEETSNFKIIAVNEQTTKREAGQNRSI